MSPHMPSRTFYQPAASLLDGGARAEAPVPDGAAVLSTIDIDLLQGAADTGSLLAAAKQAGMTHRAAERRLTRLERLLGVALVVPGGGERGGELSLTPAGTQVLVAATRLRHDLANVVSQVLVQPDAAGVRHLSTLRLAGIGHSWEDWLIDELASRMDGLVLTVLSADPAEARTLFERHHVDAFYSWQVPGRKAVTNRQSVARWVLDEPLWVAMPDRHPAAQQAEVSLADLADDKWIVGPWPGVDLLTTASAAAGFTPRISDVSSSRSVRRSLLLQGLRVGLVSPVSTPPIGDTSVVCRSLREPVIRRHVLYADPAVVGPPLHTMLCDRLRRGYLAVARLRNPAYARSAAFPLRSEDLVDVVPPDDPAMLDGLPSHSDGRSVAHAGPALELADAHLLQAIAACGSINRAARLLSITQPALSRRLSRLEGRLGMRLLVRGPRGAAFTEVGRRLVELAADSEVAFRSAMERLHAHPASTAARVAVADRIRSPQPPAVRPPPGCAAG
jgi:molybdate transport repressor ModE-like protein